MLIGVTLGLRLLTGFEADVAASPKKTPQIQQLDNSLETLRNRTYRKAKKYIGDRFINTEEYNSLRKDIKLIITKIQEINSLLQKQKGNQKLIAKGQLQIKDMQDLLLKLKSIYDKDQQELKSAPQVNLSKWWGKDGIYQGPHKKGKAFYLVI